MKHPFKFLETFDALGRTVGAMVAAGFALALPVVGSGADGDLDPSFGIGGKVVTDFGTPGDAAYGVATTADRKIIVAGQAGEAGVEEHVILARFNSDGSLDSAFGSGGRVASRFSSPFESARAVALQLDGKIVIAGRSGASVTGGDFLIARYNPEGSVDSGFGQGGYILTDFGSAADNPHAIAIQPDGKIVVVGDTIDGDGNFDFAISRFGANGTLDSGFGVGGKLVAGFSSGSDSAQAVAVQPDGKILVAGGAGGQFVITRYTAEGAPDATFNGSGQILIGLGEHSAAEAITLQPDGRIVVAGHGESSGISGFAVVRLAANGTIDPDFAAIRTTFGTGDAFAAAMALQRDEKIVAVGHTEVGGVPGDFAIARYTPDGLPDPTFGAGGQLVTDFGGTDFATSVAVDGDGRLVAAGFGNHDVALARYLADGPPDEDNDGIPDTRDPDTVAHVVSALPDSAFANGEHAQPFLNRLDAVETMLAAGDLDGARTELQNLRRKVDGCGATADTNDWIVDCTAQLQVRALIDDLLTHLQA